jgi:transcription elongation factor Elf1
MKSTNCPRCGETLTAATWSEYLSITEMRQLWCCAECGHSFETVEPVDAKTMPAELVEQLLSDLVVA